MSKYLFLTVLSTVLFVSNAVGAVGCRTGNFIYTVQSGTYFDGGTTMPLYTSSDRITIRNWPDDPNCGILRTTSENYSVASGGSGNPQSKCTSQENVLNQGLLVNYSPSDSNCMALPLDDYMPYLISSIGFLGFIIIRKKSSILYSL